MAVGDACREEGTYTFIPTLMRFLWISSGTAGRVTWSVDNEWLFPFLPLTTCRFGILSVVTNAPLQTLYARRVERKNLQRNVVLVKESSEKNDLSRKFA